MTDSRHPPALLQHCPSCLSRRVGQCQAFTDDDLRAFEKHHSGSRRLEKGEHLYHDGDQVDQVYSLVDGWVMLYELLPDGRRQILEFLLPGAVIGFAPQLHEPKTHSAECLTPVIVCVFSDAQFLSLLDEHPDIALRLARSCARKNISLHQHLTSLGRRTARERTAHLLLEFYVRLAEHSLTDDQKAVTIPLTQEQIADALGLSRSRTNQILQSFADDGIVDLKRMSLDLRNRDALADLAGVSLAEEAASPI